MKTNKEIEILKEKNEVLYGVDFKVNGYEHMIAPLTKEQATRMAEAISGSPVDGFRVNVWTVKEVKLIMSQSDDEVEWDYDDLHSFIIEGVWRIQANRPCDGHKVWMTIPR